VTEGPVYSFDDNTNAVALFSPPGRTISHDQSHYGFLHAQSVLSLFDVQGLDVRLAVLLLQLPLFVGSGCPAYYLLHVAESVPLSCHSRLLVRVFIALPHFV
jgi:hypothetical protein